MKRDLEDGEAGPTTTAQPPSPQQDFLERCGRYASVTPPLVVLLLSTAGPDPALAASGRHRRDPSAPDTDDVGEHGPAARDCGGSR